MARKLIHKLSYGLFVLLLASSCSRQIDPILTDACKPPCWNNVVPGVSTSRDILNLLNGDQYVEQNTINHFSATQFLYSDGIGWDFSNHNTAVAFLENDVVVEIDFENTNYRLGDLNNRFGEPDIVILSPYRGNKVTVNILYRKDGMLFIYEKNINSNNNVSIKPRDRVTRLTYFFPDTLQNILDQITYNSRKYYGKTLGELIQNWKGYAEFPYR